MVKSMDTWSFAKL